MIEYNFTSELNKEINNNNDINEIIAEFLTNILEKNNSPYHSEFIDYIDWIDSPEFMLSQIEGINHFVNKVDKFKRFIFIGMGASSIIPQFMSNKNNFHDKKDFIFIDGSNKSLMNSIIENPSDCLLFFISKNGKTIETQSIMNQYISLIIENDPNFNFNEHLIAITDFGSDLYNFAIKNNFSEVFSNPPNISGRFSPISYTGLIPAALSGINIKKLLEGIIDFKERLITKSDSKIKIIELINTIYDLLNLKIDIFRLSTDDSNNPKLLWVQQMISESLAKNNHHIIPILKEHTIDINRKDIIDLEFNEMSSVINKNTNKIIFKTNFGDDSSYGVFIYTTMIVITALSYIESNNGKQFNPYTQPNVEIAKSEFNRHNIFDRTNNILTKYKTISSAKYISFLFYCGDKNKMHVEIQKIINHMNIKNIPFFIDIAPSYLHTTGELHKKHIDNVHHFIVYDNYEIKNKINLNEISNLQLHSEISIFKKNHSNFNVIHLNEIKKHLKLL